VPFQRAAVAITAIVVVATSLPYVPREYADFRGVSALERIDQRYDTYGTDTIADMYESKVVLNDVTDMYTKRRLDQTPVEAVTWSKEASSPYPPSVLLAAAGLYRVGQLTGLGYYGMVLGLAAVFLSLSAAYFLRTRWYLFPLLYLNFSFFAYRFVYVQDGTYLIMLVIVMAALFLSRRLPTVSHLLMALAITMKISPLYYAKNVVTMAPRVAAAFVVVMVAGLLLPYFLWENYLYIYRFGHELKGGLDGTLGAFLVAVPFALVLWYVETRAGFNLEDRIGWGLVPVALFFAVKMNVARHLILALLVPDRRAGRNVAIGLAMASHYLMPSIVLLNSVLPIATVLLGVVLVGHLHGIGWKTVRSDLRQPLRTLGLMLGSSRPVGDR